jgi:hypothetical protein
MKTSLLHLILASAALTLLPGAIQQANGDTIATGQLYVADYGKSVLDRYQYTFDVTLGTITNITANGIGGSTTNAFFLGDALTNPIKEGLQGTANDLIVVVGPHGNTQTTLQRYTLGGALIGTIPVDFTPYNNGNIGIGNVAITADGKFEYAPLETANAIVKIDLSSGNIVASFNFASAHDVAIAANGDVYAADYNAATPRIIRLDSNLAFKQDLVTSSPSGVTAPFRPTGLSIAPDGSLYVQNNDNTLAGSDSVFHYTFVNNSGTLTANFDSTKSYIGSASNNALQFTFGNNLGPDGNLYIAALGGGGSGGFNIQNGYIDGIYKFTIANQSVSQFIQGYLEKTGPDGPSGLSAPKYLQFDTNFINAPDAGVTPEPGTTALLLAGLAGLGLKRARSRFGIR